MTRRLPIPKKAAVVFAGAFSVPREHFVREIGERRKMLGNGKLVQLKRAYGVGAAEHMVRLRQVGVMSESTLAHAFQTLARLEET